MTDREALSLYLAEVVGTKPVTGPLRDLLLQLVAQPKVHRRWPSLTAAEVWDHAARYLDLVRESEAVAA